MFDEWNEELRNLLYEGELDVAARSNAVMSIDAIVGAQNAEKEALTALNAELTGKLSDTQNAMTRLVLENSKYVAANAATVKDEVIEDVVETVVDDEAMLSDALDNL